VGSNPEPEHSVRRLNTEHPVAQANTRRPEPSYLLEVKRRLSWIAFEQSERSVCMFTDSGSAA
jgi:hypothetical protein